MSFLLLLFQNLDRVVRGGHNSGSNFEQHSIIHSAPSRPMDSLYLQQQRLRAPFPNQSDNVSPRVSSISPALQPVKSENILPVNFSESKPRFVSDLIHLAIERSFRDNEQHRTLPLPLALENSQNTTASSYQDRMTHGSTSSVSSSSSFPIHPHDIKKEITTDTGKIQSDHSSNDIRGRFDSQSPQTHVMIKPEVMPSTVGNFSTNYSSDSKTEVQEKNARQLEDSSDSGDHPPAKKEKLDSGQSMLIVSDLRTSSTSSPYLPISPPPTANNQTKPSSTVETPPNNPNSEDVTLTVPSREGFYGPGGRNVDSPRVDDAPR